MENNYREEKIQILKMVEEGKITVEDGVELLDALGENFPINNKTKNPKWLKIKVYDPDDDTKVNVVLPITFINLGMKFAYKFSPELKDTGLDEDDFKELFDAIKNGAEGKLVDVESENGEKVEIVVE